MVKTILGAPSFGDAKCGVRLRTGLAGGKRPGYKNHDIDNQSLINVLMAAQSKRDGLG